MKEVLFVLSAPPLPIDDGIKKINDNLIRAFLEEGYRVTLAVPEGGAELPYPVQRITYRKRRTLPGLLAALAKGKPLYFPLYYDPALKAGIDKERYDLIFYDFYPMTQYADGLAKEIFLMPDSMKALALSSARNEKGMVRKLYGYLNYLLARRYNRRIGGLKKLYVSREDIEIDGLPNSRFFKIPPDLGDFRSYREQEADPDLLAFRGVMSFEPNVTAVRTFYRQVFRPLASRFPRARFKVIGKDPSPELVRSCPENTLFTGFVDDVFAEMAAAAVHVVPMVSGTGVKTKLLDSIALKRLVFATPKALHGVFDSVEEAEAHGIVVYRDPEEFARKYRAFLDGELDGKAMAEKAYAFATRTTYRDKVAELEALASS